MLRNVSTSSSYHLKGVFGMNLLTDIQLQILKLDEILYFLQFKLIHNIGVILKVFCLKLYKKLCKNKQRN